jgi:phosphatidylinositol 4-phosphatase
MQKNTYLAFSIYGLVKLQVQTYLVVVTKAEFAANIVDRYVYRATEFVFVPLSFKDSAEDEVAISDKVYINMFQKIFTTKSLYFSPAYDITRPFAHTIQNAFKITDHDNRFVYNQAYVAKFQEPGFTHLFQPFISGLVEQRIMNINQKAINFVIISRRDKTRAGFRFISRGADPMGNVSNFAETEQIISFLNEDHFDVYTYLQTRGSIPLTWKQTPNLKWSPKVSIETDMMKLKNVSMNHLNKIKKIYGENHLINLIDKKGSQKIIGEHFNKMIKNFDDQQIRYTWFDFHAECANMQWHNLATLIQESLQDYKYGHFKVYKRVASSLRRQKTKP